MKKLLLVLIVFVFGLSFSSKAYDFYAVNNDGDTIYYNIISSVAPLKAEVISKYIVNNGPKEYYGSISIPDSVFYNGNYYRVTSIGEKAFYRCNDLTAINIPNSVDTICRDAFMHTGLLEVNIPNSVVFLGDSVFEYCKSLKSVKIGNSVNSIGQFVFAECDSLTSVEFGNSVKSIGYKAFWKCYNLKTISFSKSLVSIGNWSFADCSSFTMVNIPNSVKSVGYYAFCNCTGLNLCIIGDSVTDIGGYAFKNCINLKDIIIGKSITTLGPDAFYTTPWFEAIPEGMVYIGKVAYFYKGKILKQQSVNIKEGIEYVFDNAFNWQVDMPSITLPSSLTALNFCAFYNCTGLKSITCYAEIPPKIASLSYVFYNVDNTIPVYVPSASINLYKNATRWSEFINYKAIEENPQDKFNILMFPNPVKDEALIMTEFLYSDADLIVYNLIGKEVKRMVIDSDQNKILLDVRDLAKGLYFIRIVNEAINETKKLIVQ